MGYKWRNRNVNNLIMECPDKGCAWAPKCTECPFEICFDDVSNKTKRKLGKMNKEQIKQYLARGVDIDD